MDAILTKTLPFLLLAALTALATDARPSPTSGPMRVQKPFNLKKTSYNFNSTLYWDYNITSIAPYFQVEYKNNVWMIVENCEKISHNYCDLSEKIVDPYAYYAVRVKALVGAEMSEYAKTEFYLIDDGIIGPPTLNASVDGKFINVDVWYPNVPHVDGKNNVGDYLEDLTYDIYYGNETEETDECDRFGCSISILIRNQTKYCFSAQGISISVPMTIEKSKEICLTATVPNGTSYRLRAIIISILVVVVIVFALGCFFIKRKIEAKPTLPVSLNSIAKVMTTRMYLPSNQSTKYDQVSVSPIDSPVEKTTPEVADEAPIVTDESDIRESIDHGYQSSLGETEQKADEDQNGEEELSSSNYYHTENSNSSSVCIKEDDVTMQEPIRDIKPVTNSYGYDKPHCPL